MKSTKVDEISKEMKSALLQKQELPEAAFSCFTANKILHKPLFVPV